MVWAFASEFSKLVAVTARRAAVWTIIFRRRVCRKLCCDTALSRCPQKYFSQAVVFRNHCCNSWPGRHPENIFRRRAFSKIVAVTLRRAAVRNICFAGERFQNSLLYLFAGPPSGNIFFAGLFFSEIFAVTLRRAAVRFFFAGEFFQKLLL